ncbi:inositol monophosphatase [bacterium]|nr:inositol monophosphatase [bacterium]
MNKHLEYAKQFAKEAGVLILKKFRNPLEIEKKGVVDIVTDADKKAEAYIIGSIYHRFPQDSILAEESGEIDKKSSSYRWIIDPIDGTTNFAQGFSMFAVSIGIEYEGELVIGVVYIPHLNELFYAIKGGGAYLNDKKISISSKTDLIDSVWATGFPYNKRETNNNNLLEHNKAILACRDIRRAGSAAIDMVYTACGIWDGYWEKGIKPWDIAAGYVIVKEAGGVIEGIDGSQFNLFSGEIITGNREMVSKMRDIIYPSI